MALISSFVDSDLDFLANLGDLGITFLEPFTAIVFCRGADGDGAQNVLWRRRRNITIANTTSAQRLKTIRARPSLFNPVSVDPIVTYLNFDFAEAVLTWQRRPCSNRAAKNRFCSVKSSRCRSNTISRLSRATSLPFWGSCWTRNDKKSTFDLLHTSAHISLRYKKSTSTESIMVL